MPILSKMAESFAALALDGRCKTSARSGVERLFQHIARRLREQQKQLESQPNHAAPTAFLDKADAQRIWNAAEATGTATPAFCRLLRETGGIDISSEIIRPVVSS